MAKYLEINNGRTKEVQPVNTSAGAGDAAKIPELDAVGRLSETMMPIGFGDDATALVASETLSAGDLVNVFDDTGTAKMRKADATTAGKEADGYVLSAVTVATSGTIYYEGVITGMVGLTIGARYYLDGATPGGIVSTPPSTSNNVVQYIGRAISATEITFEPDAGIILV